MIARLALVLLVLALSGCRAFEPPSNHRPGDGCHADSDCGALAICNNGQCDTTHCHVNAQCQSELCVGIDGGLGTCATRLCSQNADCGQAFVCRRIGALIGCVPGCDSLDDCPAPRSCSHEFSSFGTCVGQCRSDADCGAGGFCYSASDGGITSCVSFQITNCHRDSECPGCLTCSSQNPNIQGFCINQNSNFDGGPPILGNRAALAVQDNLASTVAFVQSAIPGSGLVRIGGSKVQADGTVNLSDATDFSSDWIYSFVTADGGSLSVYFNSRARKCGTVIANGSAETNPPIADAAIPQLITPATFIADFITHPLCNAWQGTTSDSFYVLGRPDGGAILLANMKDGDSFFGDALSGQGTYSCQ